MGPTDPADVSRQLARWVAAGRLIRLRRGLYAFGGAEAAIRRSPHPFVIANRLVPGSYVSLGSVLALSGLIPEYVPAITSVTTGRPGRRVTPLGAFVYRHVSAAMFWGFETHTLEGGGHAYVATPEKALVDLLAYSGEADRPFHGKAISNPVQADRSGAKRRGLGLKAT